MNSTEKERGKNMKIIVPNSVLSLGNVAPKESDPFQISGIVFRDGRATTSNGHWIVDVVWSVEHDPDPNMKVIVPTEGIKLAVRSINKRVGYVAIEDEAIDTGTARIAYIPIEDEGENLVSWIDSQGDYSEPEVSEIALNPFYLESIAKTLCQATGITRNNFEPVRINLQSKTHSVRLRIGANDIVATAYIMPMVVNEWNPPTAS